METVVIIGSIILPIGIVIGAIIYHRMTNHPKEQDLHIAESFLESYKNDIYNMILSVIRDFDYSDYPDFTDVEAAILTKIIRKGQAFLEEKLESGKDILPKIVYNILSKGMIEAYIDELISNFNVEGIIETHINKIYQSNLDNSVTEDNLLQEEFSNEENYFANEESNKEDLDKVDEEELEKQIEKENAKHIDELNPVREEEEPYNPDDPSMELLDSDEETFIDKKGRLRYKANGRYAKTVKPIKEEV